MCGICWAKEARASFAGRDSAGSPCPFFKEGRGAAAEKKQVVERLSFEGKVKLNITNVIIQTLGGLGLFILGMKMMTEGLQMTAGKRIKKILGAISSNRVIGCLTGAGVTAMVQSSSATTVMLIGFVGAGMMTLQQAVGVILGANVGTTFTAQLIAFKLTKAALPAITVGVGMKFFAKKMRYRYIGEVILGFGLLFYGISTMKNGLAPIKNDPAFIEFFTRFDPSTYGGILLCVAMGAVVTIMVQSSSATVGLTMALATQGLITFPGAMALVLGENIGTTITAELATIGSTNINAHRTARAHTLFNVLGVGLMVLIFPWFVKIVEFTTLALGGGSVTRVVDGNLVNVSRYIANGHTMFNILNAAFFLCFLPQLIKIAMMLSPGDDESEDLLRPPSFDNRFLGTPIAALANAKSEIIRMAEIVGMTLENTSQCVQTRDMKKLAKYKRYEEHVDVMQREIIAYLTMIYQNDVSDSEAREISRLMRMVNNLERMGDAVENVAILGEKIGDMEVNLTDRAKGNMSEISDKVAEFLEHVIAEMRTGNGDRAFFEKSEELENEVDDLREIMREEHIERLRTGECSLDASLMFIGMLSNYERMGDYCFSISKAVSGKMTGVTSSIA